MDRILIGSFLVLLAFLLMEAPLLGSLFGFLGGLTIGHGIADLIEK